jgi:hypothetical protein
VLRRIRGLLRRTNHHGVGPSSTVWSSMNYISTRLYKHLSGEHYRWKENESMKTFECLILSKFLLDYALLTFIPETRAQLYRKMADTVFESLLKTAFPLLELSDFVRNKLRIYSGIMSDASDPTCWQRLAGACTGIDYCSEKSQSTLAASSLVLPALLRSAQDSWEKVITAGH